MALHILLPQGMVLLPQTHLGSSHGELVATVGTVGEVHSLGEVLGEEKIGSKAACTEQRRSGKIRPVDGLELI